MRRRTSIVCNPISEKYRWEIRENDVEMLDCLGVCGEVEVETDEKVVIGVFIESRYVIFGDDKGFKCTTK